MRVPPQPSPLAASLEIPVLSGPTASGKTALALEFCAARKAKGQILEIINADSLLVTRRFDIGTAKPSLQEREQIPHHLIDCCEPEVQFTAADFVRETLRLTGEIQARGGFPLIVGGTPFYLKALFFGIWDAPPTHPEFRKSLEDFSNEDLHQRLQTRDPARAQQTPVADRYRVIRALEILEFSNKSSLQEIEEDDDAESPVETPDEYLEDEDIDAYMRAQHGEQLGNPAHALPGEDPLWPRRAFGVLRAPKLAHFHKRA